MTQVRVDWLKPRSCWIDGRATLTIEESNAFINMAKHTTIRAIQRRRSCACCDSVRVVTAMRELLEKAGLVLGSGPEEVSRGARPYSNRDNHYISEGIDCKIITRAICNPP